MFVTHDGDRLRRTLLASLAAAASAAFVGARLSLGWAQTPEAPAKAQGAALPHLAESDPLAQSLGYKEDASKADKAKFPNYKPGQKCSGCRFYQGKEGEAFGPCQIFVGKAVKSDGWCSSFNPKA